MSETLKLIAKRIVELNEQTEESVEDLFAHLEGESISATEIVKADRNQKEVDTENELLKLIAKRIVELNEQSEKSVEELFEDLEGESISPSEVVEADMKRKGVVTDVDLRDCLKNNNDRIFLNTSRYKK